MRKIICSFPRQSDSWHFDAKYKAGELELVPAGQPGRSDSGSGAGIGGVLYADRLWPMLAEGKETRIIYGRSQVLKPPFTRTSH